MYSDDFAAQLSTCHIVRVEGEGYAHTHTKNAKIKEQWAQNDTRYAVYTVREGGDLEIL